MQNDFRCAYRGCLINQNTSIFDDTCDECAVAEEFWDNEGLLSDGS